MIELDFGILVYPPETDGEPWRAVFTENGQRKYRQGATEAKLAEKPEGRGRAGGERGHVGAGDLQRVQQPGERVGLIGRRGAGRQCRAEVAEPGRGDHPAAREHIPHRHQSLVASAEDGVDGKQWLARAPFGVFHRAERGLDRGAVDGGQPGTGRVTVAAVPAGKAPAGDAGIPRCAAFGRLVW